MDKLYCPDLIAVGGIWTHDLDVMSVASYQTALPRDKSPRRELNPAPAAWKAAVLTILQRGEIWQFKDDLPTI